MGNEEAAVRSRERRHLVPPSLRGAGASSPPPSRLGEGFFGWGNGDALSG